MPDLSVVTPTRGRPSLAAAVASALTQHELDVEVIVVDASGQRAAEPIVAPLPQVAYLGSETPLTPGEARQLGCSVSTGRWVAFLDDDDVFFPHKGTEQIGAAVAAGASFATSDFVTFPYDRLPLAASANSREWELEIADLLRAGRSGPKVRPRPGERLSSYLFERRSLQSRCRLVTSSWLVRGDIARAFSWNATLNRFEDWEWLLRLERAGVRWLHVAEPHVGISLGGPQSLSASGLTSDPSHLAWPIPFLAGGAPRPLGDLIACDIGVTLAKSGDVRGAWRSFRVATIVGRPGWRSRLRFAGAVVAAGIRRAVHRASKRVAA